MRCLIDDWPGDLYPTRDESTYSTTPERGDAPVDEDDLVPLATVLDLVLEIVDSPSALVVGELLEESLVVGVLGLLENDDLGEGRVEAVDDKFVLPLHEVLVAVDAIIGDGDARGLSRASEHDARGE